MIRKILPIPMLFFVFIFCSCSEEKDGSVTLQQEVQQKENLRQMMLTPSENRLAIIAIKYGVPEESLDIIVNTYLEEHDLSYRLMRHTAERNNEKFDFYTDTSVIRTIKDLSDRTGIETKTIASIIIDYEAWVNASEIRNM